ncbi:uncharacterized protein LOC112589086 [Harpegnathos saltator]|uniref:uncharacterized protein LOC112589086 n=1 Tax=Harpegnathos saltator TaxID=610380 RepID=UPI000DBED015|nr:uncharacterized protein LOC112589086 [Harpegnathos saltator]
MTTGALEIRSAVALRTRICKAEAADRALPESKKFIRVQSIDKSRRKGRAFTRKRLKKCNYRSRRVLLWPARILKDRRCGGSGRNYIHEQRAPALITASRSNEIRIRSDFGQEGVHFHVSHQSSYRSNGSMNKDCAGGASGARPSRISHESDVTPRREDLRTWIWARLTSV